ncbi:hypothetical protein [Streptomyces flavofungini]|uniref:Secreted protein n=1 Tax=Streptomyces flavofungini TaxID=68200 RepID=A0ABS0X420_9ACTN|nr:hypothetical protein [Streptomyces flavofungini]MBJ3807861.1 hypothetical protein [Streptomyces flavofungini]GHC78805.1 hypothetical protein GCM10010349_60220 [Streptomyces flavofungini]
MQHPAVPELAHTVDRPWATRPIHWVATAAALAAVVAASGFLQTDPATAAPTDAKQQSAPQSRSAPAPAPDPAAVAYPLDCPAKSVVAKKATGDLDGDGRAETVAAVHCAAGSGTPPHALYVITRTRQGEPRVVATLLDTKEGRAVRALAVRHGAVTATLLGYSSLDVPRYRPDLRDEAKWQWKNGAFTRSTPGATRGV